MFTGEIEEDKFYEKYGGQKYRGIATPSKYPFIYLIYSEGKYEDNLDVDGDGSGNTVHYHSEGEGLQERGNRAIIEHRYRKGVYNSIFLFRLKEGKISFIDEYELAEVVRKEDNRIDYFVLKKVKVSLDDVKAYYVDKIEDKVYLSEIGRRSNLFQEKLDINRTSIDIAKDIHEGNFLDGQYKKIEVDEYMSLMNKERRVRVKENTKKIKQKENIQNFSVEVKGTNEEEKVAQHLVALSGCNKDIIKKQKNFKGSEPPENIINCFLYTVNVGCGLTNFLVLSCEKDKEVWCFDCGQDMKGGYEDNINKCVADIQRDFKIKTFKIDKLFISHPDADHFDCLNINYDWVKNSEVWISGHIKRAGQDYVNLLTNLLQKTHKFIEPVSSSSTANISIMHPVRPIVLDSKKNNKKVDKSKYNTTCQRNNVSPIVKVEINGHSCIFPGDIMQVGWKMFHRDTGKGNSKIKTDLYIHSHHGSKNGFIMDMPKKGKVEYDVIEFEKSILSTNSTTHTGIPSNNIITHPDYSMKTNSTQLSPVDNLIYYKTDLMTCNIIPITK